MPAGTAYHHKRWNKGRFNGIIFIATKLIFLKSIPSGKLLWYNGTIDKFELIEETLMNEFSWPYVSHDKELFLSKIILAESYLQKFGAKYIGKMNEIGRWFSQDGFYAIEHMEKNVWKFKEEYVRVDRVYFTEKPFIVLEFSKKKEGSYKDADPFPYDMSELDFEQEIMFSLGIK